MKLAVRMTLIGLLLVSSASAIDWPQWRGPNRDGVSKETGLLQSWPEGGPAIRWRAANLGTGYSTPAVTKGRVYLQSTRGANEVAMALDEKTGAPVWEVVIGKVGKNEGPQYPGTRSTPTIDGDRLYCLASDGQLVCLDTAQGERKWGKHLRDDLGGQAGRWAFAESVLIDGDTVVCTPGGSASAMAALNKNTGDVIWKTTPPEASNAEYASIMVVDKGPTKQYVTYLRNALIGVDAKSGKFLWSYPKTVEQGANILTPVVVDDRVFSAGTRSGGALVELKADGAGTKPNELYFDQKLGAGIGGVVVVDGYVYGTGAQAMYCADFATGEIKWTDRAVGAASLCYADGRLYVRGHDSGDVVLVEPTPAGYREKGRFKQADRSMAKAWPHPIVANGGLYVRDDNVLLCYEVRAPK